MTPRSSSATADVPALEDVDALVGAVLEEEGRRHTEQEKRATAHGSVPNAPLPGVGAEKMAFRDVLRGGGLPTLGVLCTLPFLDSISGSLFAVLGPDIQTSLHISLTMLGLIGTAGGAMVLLAAIPFGRLGDRYPRWRIIAIAVAIAAAATFWAGHAHAAWQLLLAMLVAGLARGTEGSVQGSLIADAFPIEGRNRAFGAFRFAGAVGGLTGPLIVGGIAVVVGGTEGWRWAFYLLAFPTAAIAVISLLLPEPRRGKQEMAAVLGEVLAEQPEEMRISMRAAFARLKKIRSFYFFLMGASVLGFNLIAASIYAGPFLVEKFNLGAGSRGLLGAVGGVGTLIGTAIGAPVGERLYRRSPALVIRVAAALFAVSGVFWAAAYYMPTPVLFGACSSVSFGCLMSAFVLKQSTFMTVLPFRLRATGGAMFSVYMTLFGGVGGAIIIAELRRVLSLQASLAVVAVLASALASVLLLYGSRYVEGDMALASADLLEAQQEARRMAAGGATAALQVRNLDFSYGQVQVLFNVNLDVWEGEVLALLGTNGAGKSTVLRAVTGLGQADRGVIRVFGKTLDFAEPSTRLQNGIVLVPGGKATFPELSVRENLLARAYSVRRDGVEARMERALEAFPVLRERIEQRADTLSGGEQQMLAIAGALMLEPKVLLIDELSLGLAPIMVQQLMEVVAALKERGLTILIVEQSLNVALSLADRAVFMEKGQVRFEGPAHELLERDDLVRAVFLGADGG